ncbi:MAG: hypothetical protein GY778_29900 [bacterium]|nr:hypothetical protein [bacterium]
MLLAIGSGPVALADAPAPRHHDPGVHGCGKAQAAARHYRAEKMRADWQAEYDAMLAAGLREALTDTDLLHCDLSIEVRPAQFDNLLGTNTLTVKSLVDGLTQFTFRLRSQYNITSATMNGGTPVTVSTPSSSTRVATLDRVYNTGETFDLTIVYSGHAESRGFGSIDFTTHSGNDIVSTLSEPYFAYTWWPAKDGDFGEPGDNSDKFTIDVAVTAPSTMVSASNGVLLAIDDINLGRRRYRWSHGYPITTYLVCFSSTNYNTYTYTYVPLAGGTMDVLLYLYPEHDTTGNRAAWAKCVDMLYALRPLYGEYPFVNEKYGMYESPFGGGMEHQTFTAQGTFAEWVTVHELGHQWFGDWITCKTWNHIWLNEGFASYTEALWAEFEPGSSGLPALKSTMAAMKYTGGGSVYVTDAEVAGLNGIFDGNTSYDKGAWVVHMMRHVLGDTDFFAVLIDYQAAHGGGAATTEDFQAVCETYYGSNLDWFFLEWVYGEYLPKYAFGWQSLVVDGQDYLALYVDQTQPGSYQRFTMPIDVVVDGTTYVVFNDNDPEHFLIPLPAAASSVDLDPDDWILQNGVASTAYIPGPPKIVATDPAPGALVGAAASLSVTFHTDVNTSAGDYSLVGQQSGAQSLGFSYNAGTQTTTLTPALSLPPDIYTLTVSDTVTAVNSGQSLDGELADPNDPASLPSGEGVAGGPAEIQFSVACALGDTDCDLDVDLGDFASFQRCYTGDGGGPVTGECQMLDFDDDEDVDLDDLADFDAALAGPGG